MFNKIERYLMRNLIAPLWAIKEKSPYLMYLKYLKENQYNREDGIRQIQEIKLSRLIRHAYHNCPYYHELFNSANVIPEDIRNTGDLRKIPILNKKDIRLNRERMTALNIRKDRLIPKRTSGSTGVSLELYMDNECAEWRRAVTIFRDSWSGWRMGDHVAAIWGNPPNNKNWKMFLRNLFLERRIYLDTLGMDEKEMLNFFRIIKNKRPTVLFGHAHSIYLFAKFLEKKGLNNEITFKGIISTAMILHDWQRRDIERTFDCKIFNRYGCEEVSLIASECEKHEGLHINTDSLIVEFIKDGRPALPGEEASIVVTDLINHGMPFIRYKINDIAVLSDTKCSCGRNSPLIEKVIGRDADYVVTPEGKLISGISLTENLSLKIPGIEQMQIEQDRLDHLKIRIVRDANFNDNSNKILYSLSQEIFGANMQMECEYVDAILQEKSGKYRFVISKVNPL